MYWLHHSPLGGGGYGTALGEGVTGEDHTCTREACHGVSYQGDYLQRALISAGGGALLARVGWPVFTRSEPGRFPGAWPRVVALAKPRDAGLRAVTLHLRFLNKFRHTVFEGRGPVHKSVGRLNSYRTPFGML
jgi:hypothetical protein